MRLVYSPIAVRDLQDIYLYIASNSLKHAAKTVESISALCEALVASPGTGHRREDLDQDEFEIRTVAEGSYNIFYTVRGDELQIVRVLHGARDLNPDLFKRRPL